MTDRAKALLRALWDELYKADVFREGREGVLDSFGPLLRAALAAERAEAQRDALPKLTKGYLWKITRGDCYDSGPQWTATILTREGQAMACGDGETLAEAMEKAAAAREKNNPTALKFQDIPIKLPHIPAQAEEKTDEA